MFGVLEVRRRLLLLWKLKDGYSYDGGRTIGKYQMYEMTEEYDRLMYHVGASIDRMYWDRYFQQATPTYISARKVYEITWDLTLVRYDIPNITTPHSYYVRADTSTFVGVGFDGYR